MPTLSIDGRTVEFTPGETIISAAARDRQEIPHYCWHKHLSIAANCRMCLVEVEKAPKLVPACQTECKEGMVVFTKSEKVRAAQRAVHEFLLINHPIDCPICDQAGECKLQDYYMRYQLAPSRMRDEKVRKHKRTPLGPLVMYDAERCILCTRCIRFMEEVAGERQLGVFNRGDRCVIGTFPGQQLDHPYSLNTVDLCPVGALTSIAFRFKQRVWNLARTPSLCPGCARGCNVHVDARAGVVYRLLPRENPAVNKTWLCDEGRLSYQRANEGRLVWPLVREEMADRVPVSDRGVRAEAGEAKTARTRDALDRALELLRPAAGSPSRFAAALSAHATCEEAYVFGRFVRDVVGAKAVALLALPSGESDKLLRLADKNPNRRGVARVLADLGLAVEDEVKLTRSIEKGSIDTLLAAGHESGEAPLLAQAARRLSGFVHLAHARSTLSEVAHVTLPTLCWVQTEGTWVNADGRAQRLRAACAPEGEARPLEGWLAELWAGLTGSGPEASVLGVRAEMGRDLAVLLGSGADAGGSGTDAGVPAPGRA